MMVVKYVIGFLVKTKCKYEYPLVFDETTYRHTTVFPKNKWLHFHQVLQRELHWPAIVSNRLLENLIHNLIYIYFRFWAERNECIDFTILCFLYVIHHHSGQYNSLDFLQQQYLIVRWESDIIVGAFGRLKFKIRNGYQVYRVKQHNNEEKREFLRKNQFLTKCWFLMKL